MSLFGDDPPPSRQPKSSLFDDEPGTKSAGSGLFNDDADNAGDSPWDFPNPKKNNARRNVVKTLLPADDVPEAYVDAFDALSEANGGVEPEQIRSLLVDGSVGAAEQGKIVEMIGGGGEPLGRSEFNVLLALIGLAQEGEELSLDAVDERRRSTSRFYKSLSPMLMRGGTLTRPSCTELPIPSLPSFKPPPRPVPQQAPQQQKQTQPPQQPLATPTAPPQASAGATQTGTMRSAGWDSDPWGSPDMHKGHNHPTPQNGNTYANGAHGPTTTQRTTSNFTTHSSQPEIPSSAPFDSTRPSTTESGWGGYSGAAADGFNAAPSGEDGGLGGFGAPGGDAPNDLGRQLRSNKAIGGVEEMITVNVLEEKEGMFMFQHRNYEVTSIRRGSKVIRRYSDFVWLLDCLHKRYPFRQLPLLPPKRVASMPLLFLPML